MKTLWITYAWEDNKGGDVEFIAQELEPAGISIKLDRWNIKAGKRLWEQIDSFITKESECDGWMIVATQNSLGSEPCKEEIAYALSRALENRGAIFPIIGLFPSSVDTNLIPAAIKTRLYVSTQDEHWKERIVSALEDRNPNIARKPLEPYSFEYRGPMFNKQVIEIRPRVGTWAPFYCGVPIGEKNIVRPIVRKGPKGHVPPIAGIVIGGFEKESIDKEWWMIGQTGEVTPTMSCLFYFDELPSELIFGSLDIEYKVALSVDQLLSNK